MSHQHNPARRAANTLKPLHTPGAVGKTGTNTPNLNAQKAETQRAKAEAKAKPPGYVSADMIRALPHNHPARLAYTIAAHQGMPAAQAAYHQVMSQL